MSLSTQTMMKSLNGTITITDGDLTIEGGQISFSDGSVLNSIGDIALKSADNTFTGLNTFAAKLTTTTLSNTGNIDVCGNINCDKLIYTVGNAYIGQYLKPIASTPVYTSASTTTNFSGFTLNVPSVIDATYNYSIGNYTVLTSSRWDGSYEGYFMYNNNISKWVSGSGTYNITTGVYAGVRSTITTTGTINGESNQILLPYLVRVNSITIKNLDTYSACKCSNFSFVGSTDGTTWNILLTSIVASSAENASQTFSITNNIYYNYYRIIIINASRSGLTTMSGAGISILTISGLIISTPSITNTLEIYGNTATTGNVNINGTTTIKNLNCNGIIQFTDTSTLSTSSDIAFKSLDNTFTGSNTFNNVIVAPTTPTIGTHLTNKSYVDTADITTITNLKAANNTFSGINTFSNDLRINERKIYLRSNPDSNHYIGYNSDAVYDGCRVAGFHGGDLFSTQVLLPSLRWNSTGVNIPLTTASENATTGALVVAGGVGIGGKINTEGGIAVDYTGSITQSAFQSGFFKGSGDGASYATHNLIIKSWFGIGFRDLNNSCTAVLDTRSGSFTTKGNISIESTTASVSATTGALVVSGGVGIGGDIYTTGGGLITGKLSSSTGFGVDFAVFPNNFSGGIFKGSGDGASYATHNLKISSRFGIGFVDATVNVCNTVLNTRTGDLTTKGKISIENTTSNSINLGTTPIAIRTSVDDTALRVAGDAVIIGNLVCTGFFRPSRTIPLYDSGWFTVNANTSYASGNLSANLSYNETKYPYRMQVNYRTANGSFPVYDITGMTFQAGNSDGYSFRWVDANNYVIRTGTTTVAKYHDGTNYINATSGSYRIYIWG